MSEQLTQDELAAMRKAWTDRETHLRETLATVEQDFGADSNRYHQILRDYRALNDAWDKIKRELGQPSQNEASTPSERVERKSGPMWASVSYDDLPY